MSEQLEAGICPKCKEYLLVKSGVPFLVCPLCGQTISNQESVKLMDARCKDPKLTDALIADCVLLEAQYGPTLPYMILGNLVDNFPRLESPAYLITKMSGFETGTVYQYLKDFAGIKSEPGNVPWAEEFLDNCLDYRNMEFAELFFTYIDNKIRPEKKDEYRKKVQKLLKEYTYRSADPRSTKWLMALYIGSSILNVLLLPLFMLVAGALSFNMLAGFACNVAIALVAVCGEILLLYVHHRVFGNRLNMGTTERLWMVIFLSTLVFAIGASIMGSVWHFEL